MSCPFKKINHSYYPDNTCVIQQTYCNHIGSYIDCDVHKRHTRIVDTVVSLTKERKNEEN